MESQESRKKELLSLPKTIAVVGLSPDETKPSNVVAKYLIHAGFTVIPVNPSYQEILGRQCYPTLSDIPGVVDIVDIFMRPEKLLPVVREAITLRPKCIWLQLGIVNGEAKGLVEAAGIMFIMDLCIKLEHARLFG
jgi:predicted CoA-binding protein